MAPQSWIGKMIGGRYRIEALLGQGGMSAVYKATDPNLRRLVAIKLIHAHLSSDPNFVGRFKEEAAAVARLRHPNIVQVHDFNVDDDTYYMVMEYLVGETLQSRLKRLNTNGRHMPIQEALQICIQICEAAGYAHNHELVHRDIKPANIMLDINGQAILMDFGIVKIVGGDYHTATGATIGTAMYMSPEQIRSERTDDRADIYSLGVTLYEMLSGRPPYMADSALTLMMMVLNDPLPDLREYRRDIPESMLMVINRALAKEPNERYQKMSEMATALQKIQVELAGRPSPEEAATMPEVLAPKAEPLPEALEFSVDSIPTPPDQPVQEIDRKIVSQQPDNKINVAATIEDELPEPESRAQNIKKFTQILRSKLFLATASSLLALAAIITFGLIYLGAQKLPSVQITPIIHPSEPITPVTARAVVSLGKWETDSYLEKIVYSPSGDLIATTNNRDWLRFAQYRFYSGLWDVDEGKLKNYLMGQTQWIYDVAFSADGQFVGAASDDGSVAIWQVSDGNLLRKIEGVNGGVTSLDFSPNNLLLAAGTWDGTISLWQVSNSNLLRTLNVNDYGIRDVTFSPDGLFLAAGSDDNSILVWQVSDGALIHTLVGHTAPVYSVAFSPDGALIASGSDDKTIKIWQVSNGTLLNNLEEHTEAVYDIAFSPDPDATLLASGSGDGKICLWDAGNGTLLSTLTEYSEIIKSVDFSTDSHLLISGAGDGVIQFWGISDAIPLDLDG